MWGRKEGKRAGKGAAHRAMGPALLLLLGSLRGCSGHPLRPATGLSVEPSEPLVLLGGSVQLNCSLGCPTGTVQWRGLDTNLGGVVSSGGHSILRVTDATIAAEGTRICQGTCGGRHFQRAVALRVYSLPQALQLSAEPAVLVPGQPATLHCVAQRVYPPVGLELAWYRGQRLLRQADVDVEETEEGLFDVQDTLLLPAHEVAAGNEIRCQLMLTVQREMFTRAAAVAVPDVVTKQPATTSSRPPSTAPVTTGSPSTATGAAPTQSIAVITAQATSPQESAPVATRARAAATSTPSAQSATTQEGSTGALGAEPRCSLRVWALPPNGTQDQALRIECRARCGGRDVPVRWLRAPVALSQYWQEAAGSAGAALSVERAEPQHQGRYECVALGHAAPVGSLELALSPDPLSASPAVVAGTTVPLLGLIVSAVTSRFLWRRLKSQYDLS